MSLLTAVVTSPWRTPVAGVFYHRGRGWISPRRSQVHLQTPPSAYCGLCARDTAATGRMWTLTLGSAPPGGCRRCWDECDGDRQGI